MSVKLKRQYDSSDFSYGLHKTLRSCVDSNWSNAMWNIIYPLPENIWGEFCKCVDTYIRDNLNGELNKEILIKALKHWKDYWDRNNATLTRLPIGHLDLDSRHIIICFNALWTLAIDEDSEDLDTLVWALSHIYNRESGEQDEIK